LLYYMISSYNAKKYRTVVTRLNDTDIVNESSYTGKQLKILLAKSYYMLEGFKTAYTIFMQIPLNDFNTADFTMVADSALRQDDTGTVIKIVNMVKDNSEIYAEILFQLASYYKKMESYESAMEYYSRLIIEVPGSNKILETRFELADLYIQKEKYSEAIELIENIEEEKYAVRKHAIEILSLFGTDEDGKAMDIVNKHLNQILRSDYAEQVLRECLEYYYIRDDLDNVKRYARMLVKYSGNTSIINYYYARLYLKRNMYKTAYYFYYKVAQDQSEYWEESTYYLGLLSLHVYNNPSRAFGYIENVAKKKNAENDYVIKSRLLLAILLNEWGRVDRSRELLNSLQSDSMNVLTRIKAQNLYDHYGYNKDEK
ncbi:MAG: tetratricopeptide repeat protein, partial [Spirochaetota bacterium]